MILGRMQELSLNNVVKRIFLHSMVGIIAISIGLYGCGLAPIFSLSIRKLLITLSVNILLLSFCYRYVAPLLITKKKIAKAIGWLMLALLVAVCLRVVGKQLIVNSVAISSGYIIPPSLRIVVMLLGETMLCIFAVLLRMVVQSVRNKRRLEELEKLQLTTELQFLKAQMSPHFLFNSINNIYSLVLLKSEKAPEALMKLSDLLRYSLYECHGKVTVSQEIEAIRSYVELFRLKFEDPIPVTLDLPPLKDEYKIEPLLFIPLLENALKYSGIGVNPDAFVRLSLKLENQILEFSVTNTIGESDKNQSASGIGLENIRKRLANIYDLSEYEFDTRNEGDLFFVTLKICLQ